MAQNVITSLGMFDLHLFGGGRDALALAERLEPVALCVHADSLCGAMQRLMEAHGWARDARFPSALKGQCWLIATGTEQRDSELVAQAEAADIAFYAPRFAERSTLRLPLNVTVPSARSDLEPGDFSRGRVSLVGAGPGDPELLTLKALTRLREAEVLIHDRLVSDEVLALAPPQVKRFYVGKARSQHSVPQEGINQALVDWARAGYRVVRLKGGDPFMFGRGGEELDELVDAGIEFEVVPGITAALGVAAYAGIPLTHRDYAQSVRFVTGHLKNGSVDLDWYTLASAGQTLVFYMGLGSLATIVEQLVAHGAQRSTPIALVEQGTTARQRVHCGTLDDIVTSVADVDIAPPTLIVVGEVVALHSTLRWFDRQRASSLGWQDGKHPSPLEQVDKGR
ncbi:uroporphyrinogen-III C-methyltransferase [Carnimonas bestiolae]|uniref:uroporphyrinogen-III C-methyltransferase n=1 Tax=Carnimonas bestiolae TaxID=3402172 RepID=UPI003EDC3962